MSRILLLFTALGLGSIASAVQPPPAAPAAPPDTEIFLAPLSAREQPAVGRPTNITSSPGYDNKPSFTPEGEYSPTVTPDGAHISVIRVEADGTQRLWRFTLEGRAPELVLERVKPV